MSNDGATAEAREEVRELAEEVRGIAEDLRQLARSEVELAKAVLRDEGRLIGGIAAAGVVAWMTAMCFFAFAGVSAMFALDNVMPLWAAALVVAGAMLLIAVAAGLVAMSLAKQLSAGPKRSANSIREDVSWARAQLKSRTTSSVNAGS